MSHGNPSNQQVAEAIQWLVKFESGEINEQERHAFHSWRSQNPLHNMAWERLGTASQQFAPLATMASEQT
ncbi:MAG: DUF4880 domain-containing protein, partial [Pseudomonadota bacterium]